MRADNSAHIIAAARRRADDARRRAAAALRRMDASGQPVTFSAGFSRSWLYAQDDLPGRSSALAPGSGMPRHPRRSPTGSARHSRRCCAASKQPPPASATWDPRTGSCATCLSTHSANSAQRRSSRQPRHARKTRCRKNPAGIQGNGRKPREQHCP